MKKLINELSQGGLIRFKLIGKNKAVCGFIKILADTEAGKLPELIKEHPVVDISKN